MLILASASPRRSELLRQINCEFICRPASCREITAAEEPNPLELVTKNAILKAQAAFDPARAADDIVLGADTVVACGGRIFGKPHDDDEAAQMLRALSGRTHQVCTGIALVKGGAIWHDAAITDVVMKELGDEEIASYVRSGEPRDKAGAYAVQGLAAVFIKKIDGSYSNVVGLPLNCLYELMQKAGVPL